MINETEKNSESQFLDALKRANIYINNLNNAYFYHLNHDNTEKFDEDESLLKELIKEISNNPNINYSEKIEIFKVFIPRISTSIFYIDEIYHNSDLIYFTLDYNPSLIAKLKYDENYFYYAKYAIDLGISAQYLHTLDEELCKYCVESDNTNYIYLYEYIKCNNLNINTDDLLLIAIKTQSDYWVYSANKSKEFEAIGFEINNNIYAYLQFYHEGFDKLAIQSDISNLLYVKDLYKKESTNVEDIEKYCYEIALYAIDINADAVRFIDFKTKSKFNYRLLKYALMKYKQENVYTFTFTYVYSNPLNTNSTNAAHYIIKNSHILDQPLNNIVFNLLKSKNLNEILTGLALYYENP